MVIIFFRLFQLRSNDFFPENVSIDNLVEMILQEQVGYSSSPSSRGDSNSISDSISDSDSSENASNGNDLPKNSNYYILSSLKKYKLKEY